MQKLIYEIQSNILYNNISKLWIIRGVKKYTHNMIWFDIWYNKNKTVKMAKFKLFFYICFIIKVILFN